VTAMVSRTVPGPLTLIALMTTSGVFDRLPALEIYLAETNAGWMPEAFFMDGRFVSALPGVVRREAGHAPSEYAARHFYFGSCGIRWRFACGTYCRRTGSCGGSDFPHSVTSFPRSGEWLRTIFEGVPEELRRRILVENPCRFFGSTPDRAITPTPG